MEAVFSNFDAYLTAFAITVGLFVVSSLASLVLGVVLAVFRVGPVAIMRRAAGVYVTLFRNTPLLIIFVFMAIAMPKLGYNFLWVEDVEIAGYNVSAFFVRACIALTLYTSAFVCEAFRSGVNTVPLGQAEAARAVGLTFAQSMRLVVLPQALRAVVPPSRILHLAGVALSGRSPQLPRSVVPARRYRSRPHAVAARRLRHASSSLRVRLHSLAPQRSSLRHSTSPFHFEMIACVRLVSPLRRIVTIADSVPPRHPEGLRVKRNESPPPPDTPRQRARTAPGFLRLHRPADTETRPASLPVSVTSSTVPPSQPGSRLCRIVLYQHHPALRKADRRPDTHAAPQ